MAVLGEDGRFDVTGDQVTTLIKFRAKKWPRGWKTYGGIDTGGEEDWGFGYLHFDQRMFRFTVLLEDGDSSIYIRVVAYWENLAPRVRASTEAEVVECDAPGTGTVRLVGEVSDSDGSVVDTYWVVDREVVSRELETEQHLSLGEHTITLWAIDDDGAWAADALKVNVVDTTPPEIGPGPGAIYCAWPPNHKYVKLDIEEQVLAEDVCDPSPMVVYVDGWSTEPDNDVGDGDTTNDILVYEDAVCLRSERSGTGEGRRYTVVVSALDSSGNGAGTSFDVLLAHDQSGHECRALPPSTFVTPAEEASRCPPPGEAGSPIESAAKSDGSGCSVVGSGGSIPSGSLWLVLVVVLLLGARRRFGRR